MVNAWCWGAGNGLVIISAISLLLGNTWGLLLHSPPSRDWRGTGFRCSWICCWVECSCLVRCTLNCPQRSSWAPIAWHPSSQKAVSRISSMWARSSSGSARAKDVYNYAHIGRGFSRIVERLAIALFGTQWFETHLPDVEVRLESGENRNFVRMHSRGNWE